MKETKTETLQPGVRLQSKDRTYEIVKVLGVGSFGITYLATATIPIGNISTTIKFAIKEYFLSDSCYRGDDGVSVYSAADAKSIVARSRMDFLNEANRLKKICHKSRNIVSVNETFEANGTAYYVMEYLDGGNPTGCREDEAVAIILQIADAIEKIHEEGVIHMDLRPDNIVMKTNEKNGTYPVIIDFGISLYFDSKDKTGTTLTVKGASPGYSPPEQFANGNGSAPKCEFSPKYDIYALGAVLYFLCTGKNPPEASLISEDRSELKDALDGIVSDNVRTAILNAMNPVAQERTPTIQKFRDDLRGVVFIPVLEAAERQLDFSKDKSSKTIDVNSNIKWIACADEDWCDVAKKDDSIVVSVAKNNESSLRFCNVIINGLNNNISLRIKVKQSGAGTLVFRDEESWWDTNKKKIYAGAAVLAMAGCITGISVWLNQSSQRTEPVNVTEYVEIPDPSAQPVPNSIQEESAPNPTKENNEKPASDKQPLTEINTPAKPTKISDDELFAKASSIADLKALADKGYAKAYAPLAEKYFAKHDYSGADTYARRALAVNVGRSKALSVVDKLDLIGFYDNGENGGKPN